MKKHDETFEDRPCEICGKMMHVRKASTQRFCCDACQIEWQKTRVGALNPKYAHVPIICDMCGKVFMERPYKLNASNNHFCGIECRRKWYADVWSQRTEWKEESRQRSVRMLELNPKTNTKPQIVVNEILSGIGVRYNNEEPFKYYAIDNYLPDHNLAIEVMGDYWHCNKTVYDIIRYKTQYEAIRRDVAKNTYLMKYYHVPILYLWEYDILSNEELVARLIDKFIADRGNIPNYHSFNYHIEDGDIALNDEIIIPYQDMSVQEREKYYIKTAS